jgi:adenylyltransferase/sulfurtransferase
MEGLERYSRQYIMPQIGEDGQEKLQGARVVVIGCGALGCHTSSLLARAGIGFLRIVDRDIVELDNLQRQVLFDEDDLDKPKASVAESKLRTVNSGITIEGIVDDVNFKNILDFVKGADVVVDGTDNMDTRYLMNDACVKENVPFIYGGAISTYGMTMNIIPGRTACFACLFPKPPLPGSLPTCETVGVLNSVPAVIASIQVVRCMDERVKGDFHREEGRLQLLLIRSFRTPRRREEGSYNAAVRQERDIDQSHGQGRTRPR